MNPSPSYPYWRKGLTNGLIFAVIVTVIQLTFWAWHHRLWEEDLSLIVTITAIISGISFLVVFVFESIRPETMRKRETKRKHICRVALGVIAGLVLAAALVRWSIVPLAMRQRILRTNPQELLSACYELQAQSDTYRGFDAFEPRRTGTGPYVLMHPLDGSLPKVLRDLIPERIIVEPSVVWVDVPIPYTRKGITFVAYAHTNQAQEIGQTLLPALWYLENQPEGRQFYEWYD